MRLETVPYDIRIEHDGRSYDVHISDLTVPKCSNCGEIAIDESASEQVDDALRQQAGLLTPQEIREGRIRAGFAGQEDFAKCLGLGVSTVSRWESGIQIQQHANDGMLRAFFALEDLRIFLAKRNGVEYPTNSATVAASFDAPSASAS